MFVFYGAERLKVEAKACEEPKRYNIHGRVWTTTDVLIDGTKVAAHYEYVIGSGLFIPLNEGWYVVRLRGLPHTAFDLLRTGRPLEFHTKERDA